MGSRGTGADLYVVPGTSTLHGGETNTRPNHASWPARSLRSSTVFPTRYAGAYTCPFSYRYVILQGELLVFIPFLSRQKGRMVSRRTGSDSDVVPATSTTWYE